jgi:hypothetical protein
LIKPFGINVKPHFTASTFQEIVLCQLKPKLTATIYHLLKDFWQIPQFLDSLNLGYSFYLRHFTIYSEEAVF